MITMYRASTIGMNIQEYHCLSFTEKMLIEPSGARSKRNLGWYYIAETEKEAIEWLKSYYESHVKTAELMLENKKQEFKNFTEKYNITT